MTRRDLLRCAGLATVGGALAGCSPEPSPTPGPSPSASPEPSASAASRSPQGVPSGADVEFWADDSRYPTAWADELARLAAQQPTPLRVQTNATSELAATLRGRFTREAPALVLNGGSDELGVGELSDDLSDLGAVAAAPASGDGTAALQTRLRPGTLAAGTTAGKIRAIPYVYTVHGLWYSAALFREQDWQPPTSWPSVMALGKQAKAEDKYLFCWGRDGATAYLRMALAMATKQGGLGVLRALDSLEAKAWSQPEVQQALTAVHDAVRAGYVKPGGSQRSWRSAMAAWASDRTALLVPCGSWMPAQLAPGAGFELSLVPDPTLGSQAKLPATALHAGPEEDLLVPRAAKNPEAGQALLRVALGRAAATAFAEANHVIPTRTDALPARPERVLARQLELVKAAGEHVFSWRFIRQHGTNHDHQALWNTFLEGDLDVATLTRESQRISDLVAADPTQARYPVS
ncbi:MULTISPECIES: extracellular solute-binding protein [unclassified Luteococcus]|uniref:extracellular solute-binding protein n=1 Tax=unclassified Luteococcus TaxID=2639923 RepID=UPI00313B6311